MLTESYDRRATMESLAEQGYTRDTLARKLQELGVADNQNMEGLLNEYDEVLAVRARYVEGSTTTSENVQPEPVQEASAPIEPQVMDETKPDPVDVAAADTTAAYQVYGAMGDAMKHYSFTSSIANAVNFMSHPADPEYDFYSDTEAEARRALGIAEDEDKYVIGRSVAETNERIQVYNERKEAMKRMQADQKLSPIAAIVGANLLDPANLIFGGAEAYAATAAHAARGSRLAAAATGGGAGILYTAIDDAGQPDVTAFDYVAGAFAGMLGGAIAPSVFKSQDDLVKDMAEDVFQKPRYKYVGMDERTGKPRYQAVQPAKTVDPNMNDVERVVSETGEYTPLTPHTAAEYVAENAPAKNEGKISRLGGWLSGAVKYGMSESKYIRGAAAMLFENPQGASRNSTAAAHYARFKLELEKPLSNIYDIRKEYMKEQGVGVFGRYFNRNAEQKMWKEIEEARDYMFTTGRYPENLSPSVRKMADEVDNFYDTALRQSRDAGVRGADIDYRKGWTPRRWDFSKMRTVGRDNFVRDITRGILKATPEMPQKLARSLSAQIYDRALLKAAGGDASVAFGRHAYFDSLDMQKLKELGVSEDVLQEFQDFVTARMERAPGSTQDSRASHRMRDRIEIDQFTVRQYTRTSDIVELARYQRDAIGDSALAMVGIKDRRDLDNLFTGMRKQHALAGLDPAEMDEFEDMVRSAFTSAPSKIAGSKSHAVAKSYMRALALGGLGFAQAAEVGRLVTLGLAQGIFKGTGDTAEMLGRIFKLGRTERARIVKEWEDFGNVRIGEEHKTFGARSFLDEHDPHRNAFLETLAQTGAGLNEVNGYMSLYNTVRGRMQQEGWRMVSSRLVRMANGDEAVDMARLADMGIDERMWARVKQQMKANGSTTDFLNLESWDKSVADELFLSVHRGVDQAVQTVRAGETSYWMSGGTAGILTQFLNFPMVAMNKQMFRNMKHGDAEAIGGLVAELFMAGVVVTARQAAQNVGTDKFEERLTDPKLLMNIITMMPSMGLSGNIAQVLGGILGVDDISYGGRYGGVSDSFIASISPGAAMIERIAAGATAPFRMGAAAEVDRANLGALMSIVPGNNLPVMSAIKNNLLEGVE